MSECPACCFSVPIGAARCGHCGVDISQYRFEQDQLKREWRAEAEHRRDTIYAGFPWKPTLIAGVALELVALVVSIFQGTEFPTEAAGWIGFLAAGPLFAFTVVYAWRWLMLKTRGYL